MTRRTVAISWGDQFFVSQEFNGDKKESLIFGLTCDIPHWEEVIAKFKGVRSVRAFERTLEEVEQMYGYEHIPLTLQSELPQTEETWKMLEGELEQWAKYGELVPEVA